MMCLQVYKGGKGVFLVPVVVDDMCAIPVMALAPTPTPTPWTCRLKYGVRLEAKTRADAVASGLSPVLDGFQVKEYVCRITGGDWAGLGWAGFRGLIQSVRWSAPFDLPAYQPRTTHD